MKLAGEKFQVYGITLEHGRKEIIDMYEKNAVV